ncbi:DnaB-like helicase N-terminal domain-containing protein [Brucella sp. TWI432]
MVALLSFRPLAKSPNARIHVYSGARLVAEILPPVKFPRWHWHFVAESYASSSFFSADTEAQAKETITTHWNSFLSEAGLISLRALDPEVDDVERAVLGAMFLDPGHALDYVHDLHPHHFQSLQHRNIYSVLRGLITIGVDISTITAKPFLEGMSDGGTGNAYTYLSLCASRIVLKDRISDFVRVIISSHHEREIINA